MGATTRQLRWYDVFTTVPFAGNPLGVVLDAAGMEPTAMAAVAAELGLSETTFVLPPSRAGVDHDVRIFTPTSELAFAGHPTIGTAIALAEQAGAPSTTLVLGLGAGPTTVHIAPAAGGALVATFAAPQLPRIEPAQSDATAVAAAIGLDVADLDDALPPHVADVGGTTFVVAAVRDLDVLARSRPFGSLSDALGIYAVTADGAGYRARMFAPGAGIAEDPATGSAACAFAGSFVAFVDAFATDGTHDVAVTQGVEMGRRSELALSFDVRNGSVAEVRLSGSAVSIVAGTIAAS